MARTQLIANTRPAPDRASAAALAHTGGGTVTGTEVGDEQSYYPVEVTLGGGRQVDVPLDRTFNVVSSKSDDWKLAVLVVTSLALTLGAFTVGLVGPSAAAVLGAGLLVVGFVISSVVDVRRS